jgi:hypothetical protein
MNLCVSDEKVIFNIQGIRNVTWGESSKEYGYASKGQYFITVTYKGSHNIFYYQTEEAAKNIFNKIREAMDKSYRIP